MAELDIGVALIELGAPNLLNFRLNFFLILPATELPHFYEPLRVFSVFGAFILFRLLIR
jgi:hypothetical protein